MNYGNSVGKLGMMNPYYMQAKSLEEFLNTMQQANGGKLHDEVYIPEEDDIFRIYWVNVYESLLKNDIGKIL